MKQVFDLNLLPRIFIGIFIALMIFGIQPVLAQNPEVLSDVQSGESSDPTATLSQKRFSEVECSGRLVPREVFRLELQSGERVEYMAVKVGDEVKKGDLLVQLANDALLEKRSSLQEKRFAMMQTGDEIRLLDKRIKAMMNSIDQLEEKIAEERSLFAELNEYTAEKNLIQWSEDLQAEKDALSILKTERTIAVEQLAQQAEIETTYAELSEQLDRKQNALTVQAPFAGRITFIGHNYGRAMPGEQIFELIDDRKLIVNAAIRQHQLPFVHIGSRAKVFPIFFQDKFVWGEITAIGPSDTLQADDEFQTFPLTIELDHNSNELISGMGVSVKIIVDDHPGSVQQ